MEGKIFHHIESFRLESGASLPEFKLFYTTYGTYQAGANNVIWVCHALTANSCALDWWEGLIGEGKQYDPNKYFIICANILGSCYGSTGPFETNPNTGTPYFHEFPAITIRDIVTSIDLLRQHLGIEKIHTLIGGSLGGQQAVEWAISKPDIFGHVILLATNARHSAWGIAFNEAQRMAIEADPTWKESAETAGLSGMKAARATALLSYRNYQTYESTQTDPISDSLDDYKAAAYQQYQGAKLARRFNAFTYWALSKTMDTHHVGRGRGTTEEALQNISAPTLVIGISSDLLFPVTEQQFMAKNIKGAVYEEINSLYGHDGFLVETQKISAAIEKFYNCV